MANKGAKYDQKSGVVSNKEYLTMHGGVPPKKSVEQIEKENTPKNNPNALGK
jgi:hypothetical protein